MSGNRRTALAIFLILAIFAGGVYVSSRLILDGDFLAGGQVAVLPIQGVITSERSILRHFDEFRRRGSVEAFVLEIRSPGGTVGASQAIYRALRHLRKEGDERPIVAWMGDVAASGGYYVSLAADTIYALPGTLTGSIGVIMEFPNAQELLRKVGIGWEVVKSGEYKDLGSFTRPLSESERAILQGVVQDVWGQFVDEVAERRSLERDAVVALADGRIFSGEQALEHGLIDRIGTLDEAIAAAGRMANLGDRPRTVRPRPARLRLIDLLLGVSEAEARRLLDWLPSTPSATPRLLYEWR